MDSFFYYGTPPEKSNRQLDVALEKVKEREEKIELREEELERELEDETKKEQQGITILARAEKKIEAAVNKKLTALQRNVEALDAYREQEIAVEAETEIEEGLRTKKAA